MNIQIPFLLLKVPYFYLSEVIYFVHLAFADPVCMNLNFRYQKKLKNKVSRVFRNFKPDSETEALEN